jgi:hypothetical protein
MNTQYALVQHPDRGILFGPYKERWEAEEEVRQYIKAYAAFGPMLSVPKPQVTYFTADFTVAGRHGYDWYYSEIVQR